VVIFLVAALATLALPMAAFTFAPLVLGPLHLVVGAREVAQTQPNPRAFYAALALAAAAFVVITAFAPHALAPRLYLAVSVAWVAATLVRAPSSLARDLIATLTVAFATVALVAPVPTLALLIAAHNFVGLAIAFGRFERGHVKGLALVAAGLVAVVVAVPHVAGAREVAAALALPPAFALGLLYLQLAHYAAWLRVIPRASSLPRSRRFDAACALAVATSAVLLVVGHRIGDLAVVRATYLAAAGFHVVAEIIAMAQLALNRSHRRLA
jgi:hypothetical protein